MEAIDPAARAGSRPPAVEPARPAWRGRLHLWAAVVAVPLFTVLVVAADTGRQRVLCAVYGVAVTTMLAVSATYHHARTPPARRPILRRLDHSTILLAIAGSYTAIGGLALSGSSGTRLLVVVWCAAVVGIGVRMLWLHAPAALVALVYVAVGWSALLEARPLLRALDVVETGLVLGGGALYSAGALVYARRRPDPRPATFGYHEVFHALVVVAAVLHYAAVARLLAER